MACGGKVSDERISQAVIRMVIEDELKDIPLEGILSLNPDAVEIKNEKEIMLLKELRTLLRQICGKIKGDNEIQETIKRLTQIFKQCGITEAKKMFMVVLEELFVDGITWETIFILLTVVGLLVGIMVIVLCQSVELIVNWTVDFFKKYLLGWILQQGGWSRCLVSVMSSHRGGLVIIVFTTIALGPCYTLFCADGFLWGEALLNET